MLNVKVVIFVKKARLDEPILHVLLKLFVAQKGVESTFVGFCGVKAFVLERSNCHLNIH